MSGCPEDTPKGTTSDASVSADSTLEVTEPGGDAAPADIHSPVGDSPTSCGSPDQNLTPVDCTGNGDADAFCVYGNHCACSPGFECASTPLTGNECQPGDTCVPSQNPPSPDASSTDALEDVPTEPAGSTPQSCGSPDQNLTPVDCTAQGDTDAVCVFSNHCLCSTGFVCASDASAGTSECSAGDICIPAPATADADASQAPDSEGDIPDWQVGSTAESCGSPGQGLSPVDCTAYGDQEAYCVFSNHCACGPGYECETPLDASSQNECAPASSCVPSGS